MPSYRGGFPSCLISIVVSTPHCGCGNPSSILGLDMWRSFFVQKQPGITIRNDDPMFYVRIKKKENSFICQLSAAIDSMRSAVCT